MTVIDLARVAHEANRAYCETLGDDTQVRWGLAPEWQRKSAYDGVEGILEGRITAPDQSHESWMRDKLQDGWRYGAVKNPTTKEHPCLVPFRDLPLDQQKKDRLFFAVVQALR